MNKKQNPKQKNLTLTIWTGFMMCLLLEIIRHEPILLRIYFACASHFARWWGSAIVHTLNSIFGWRIKEAEPKILESRKLLSLKRPLLVYNVLWLFTETTGPCHRLWEGWVLENTARTFFFHLVCLSILKVIQLWDSSSFISSIRPGIKNKPANSVKMGDVWLLRNSNCFKCGSQQNNVPLQDEITASCTHSLGELHSICMGESQSMSSLKEW